MESESTVITFDTICLRVSNASVICVCGRVDSEGDGAKATNFCAGPLIVTSLVVVTDSVTTLVIDSATTLCNNIGSVQDKAYRELTCFTTRCAGCAVRAE